MKAVNLIAGFLLLRLGVPSADCQVCDTWVERHPSATATARSAHGMAYDSVHKQVVLFGGCAHDTWTWDGASWTQQFPSSYPFSSSGARDSFGMAYDEAHSQVVLFGGSICNTAYLSDTWLWDGTDWTQASPGTNPPGRELHALAYDSKRGQVVLFGGVVDGSLSDDTWVWDGSTWTQKLPAHRPPARAAFAMAGDPSHQNVVLVGGSGFTDTWVWDGADWTQASPAGQPPATPSAAMVYDASRGRIVYFNERCEAWLWDGSNWAEDCPSTGPVPAERYYFAAAYDSARTQAVMFGGRRRSDGTILGDTWAFVPNSPPVILAPPQSQVALAGTNVLFNVIAAGNLPLSYQWRLNGADISGATNSSFAVTNTHASDSGGYCVLIGNLYGSVVSATASLAVLADGANGNQPARQTSPPAPPRQLTNDSLVIVTHGWLPREWPLIQLGPPANVDWVDEMAIGVSNRLATNWLVTSFKWMPEAWTLDPDTALRNAKIKGYLYGIELAKQGWQHVHLIGHSAGAGVVEGITRALKRSSPTPVTVHATFLDAYVGKDEWGRANYGTNADWADSYFAHDYWADLFPSFLAYPNSLTEGPLTYTHNVDVTRLDPQGYTTAVFCPAPDDTTPAAPCGEEAWARRGFGEGHQWPHYWYYDTIVSNAPDGSGVYGFARSKEGGGWDNRGSYPVGNSRPVILQPTNAASRVLVQGAIPTATNPELDIPSRPYAISQTGVSGISFSSVKLHDDRPAWIAIGLSVTGAVNFVSFNAAFTSTNGAQGLLTAYWNTNEIGFVDERVADPDLQPYRFFLPAIATFGLYTLSFRLEAFNDTSSSIAITNLATGFTGVSEAPQLAIHLQGTNTAPVLNLTGAPGYNYLLEFSTNLTTWEQMATVPNTNGTVLFIDPAVINYSYKFYRALLP